MTYAAGTTVSVEKSAAEMRTMIVKYGASHVGFMDGPGKSVVEFIAKERRIRFVLPLPDQTDKRFTHEKPRRSYSQARLRSKDAAYKAWEQACRERWRSLCLAVKAKLDCVATGISSFESEFMAHTVDPDTGRTIGEIMLPIIAQSYDAIGESKPLAIAFEERSKS